MKKSYNEFKKWLTEVGVDKGLNEYLYESYLEGYKDAVEELAKANNIRVEDD